MTENNTYRDALNYKDAKISPDLNQCLIDLRSIMSNSSDLLINTITISGHDSAIVCCEGMVSTGTSTELIFHPLMQLQLPEKSEPEKVFEYIQKYALLTFDRVSITTYGDFMRLIMSGFVVIVVNGVAGAIALGVQGYDKRSISEPTTEVNVLGSQDGFVETIRVNMSLIRRRMKTPLLKFELFQMGKSSQTDVCLVYMTDKASKKLVDDIKGSLSQCSLDIILSSGYVTPFLEGKPLSIFSGVSTTQRPDVLCAKIFEGRVAVLIDGNPYALITPSLFVENFQTVDDYSNRPFYGTYIRWLKYFAFFLAVALPGVYVAIVNFHPEMFTQTLLLNLISAKEMTPYSLMIEALIITILYEIMREAGIRLPKVVGAAIGIVGGLVIGDAAVSSGLISAPLLIVLGLTATSSFVISGLNQQTSILRIIFIIAGGYLGLYGIALVTTILIFNICSMETYGVQYMAPISPFTPKVMKDVLIRIGFKKLLKDNIRVENLNGVTTYKNNGQK